MAKKHRHELVAGKFQRNRSCEVRVWPSFQLRTAPGHTAKQTTVAVRSYRIPV